MSVTIGDVTIGGEHSNIGEGWTILPARDRYPMIDIGVTCPGLPCEHWVRLNDKISTEGGEFIARLFIERGVPVPKHFLKALDGLRNLGTPSNESKLSLLISECPTILSSASLLALRQMGLANARAEFHRWIAIIMKYLEPGQYFSLTGVALDARVEQKLTEIVTHYESLDMIFRLLYDKLPRLSAKELYNQQSDASASYSLFENCVDAGIPLHLVMPFGRALTTLASVYMQLRELE